MCCGRKTMMELQSPEMFCSDIRMWKKVGLGLLVVVIIMCLLKKKRKRRSRK